MKRWVALAERAPGFCSTCEAEARPVVKHGVLRCMGCAPAVVLNPGRRWRLPHPDPYAQGDEQDETLYEVYFASRDWA